MNKKIIEPSELEVKKYLRKWKTLKNYVYQESSLKKLFTETYKNNNEIDEVLIKVCSLNTFYSTHILKPYKVAEHIVKLKIDEKLKKKDLLVVNKIATVKISENKKINFYSFATKYCSHHKPETYPIYDSYVEKMLIHFNKGKKFHVFKKSDLKDYVTYKKVLLDFKKAYKLTSFSLKEIDKYLWLCGKDYFQKKYK